MKATGLVDMPGWSSARGQSLELSTSYHRASFTFTYHARRLVFLASIAAACRARYSMQAVIFVERADRLARQVVVGEVGRSLLLNRLELDGI